MKGFRALICLGTSFAIAGCASTSTQMLNSEGKVGTCGAWGFGVIGTAAALISTHDCIAKYEAAGYRAVGTPQASTTTAGGGNDSSSKNQGLPTLMVSRDGLFKISLPAGWAQYPPPTIYEHLYARNSMIDAGLLIHSANGKDVADWTTHAESSVKSMAQALVQGQSSGLDKIKVNGFDALQGDVSGISKSGLRLHYLVTFVKTDNQLVSIRTWSTESRFATYKPIFQSILSGLQI